MQAVLTAMGDLLTLAGPFDGNQQPAESPAYKRWTGQPKILIHKS
jgi:hypothetical protein